MAKKNFLMQEMKLFAGHTKITEILLVNFITFVTASDICEI